MMSPERPDAPFERPEICLDHDDLAAIRRITMIEARSMAMTAASLKGAAGLSADTWKKITSLVIRANLPKASCCLKVYRPAIMGSSGDLE